MKKFIHYWGLLAMLFGIILLVYPETAKAETLDASEDVFAAETIELDQTYTFDRNGYADADICVPISNNDFNCTDYFVKIHIEKKGYYTCIFKGTSMDYVEVRLFNEDNEELFGGDCKNGTQREILLLQPGTYYIALKTYEKGSTGSVCILSKGKEYKDISYNLKEKTVKNTAVAAGEPSEDVRTAPRIALGKTYTFDRNEYADANLNIVTPNNDFCSTSYFVKVLIEKKGNYEFVFKSTSKAYSGITLYSPDNDSLAGSDLSNKTLRDNLLLTPGTYYISIQAYDKDSTGSICLKSKDAKYTDLSFNLKEKVAINTDVNTAEPSVDVRIAPRIAIGKTYTFDRNEYADANLCIVTKDSGFANDQYFVKVLVEKKANYACTFKSTGKAYCGFQLYNADNEELMSAELSNNTKKEILQLNPGTYYISIRAFDKDSIGSVSVQKIVPKKVTIKSVTSENNMITAVWSKSTNSKAYQMQYSESEDMANAKTITATTTKAKTLALSKGKTYYVRVRGYYKTADKTKVYGTWSDIKEIVIK